MKKYIALLGFRRGPVIRAEYIRAESLEIAQAMARYQITEAPDGKLLSVKGVKPSGHDMTSWILVVILYYGTGNIYSYDMSTHAACEKAADRFNQELSITAFCREK